MDSSFDFIRLVNGLLEGSAEASRGIRSAEHLFIYYHYDKERSSASGVISSLLSYVFNRKLKTAFITEYGLMLCSVETEGASDLLHKKHCAHISY